MLININNRDGNSLERGPEVLPMLREPLDYRFVYYYFLNIYFIILIRETELSKKSLMLEKYFFVLCHF